MSIAVSINLVLYGLVAPFAAALIDRFGLRRVISSALVLIAVGAGGSVAMTASWHLLIFWGLLIGAGTGAMALMFAATIAERWFVKRRGLVMGALTAGAATGQLVILPLHRRGSCGDDRLATRIARHRRRGADRLPLVALVLRRTTPRTAASCRTERIPRHTQHRSARPAVR